MADEKILVEVVVAVDPATAWKAFVTPESVVKWNFASPDWCCPRATNDLKVGGTFSYRMEAKDGSFAFDFEGIYSEVVPQKRIRFTLGQAMGDSREVIVEFHGEKGGTRVIERFDPEGENTRELQRSGWQAILDNYKKVAEASLPLG